MKINGFKIQRQPNGQSDAITTTESYRTEKCSVQPTVTECKTQ